jgi:hypothetical protein
LESTFVFCKNKFSIHTGYFSKDFLHGDFIVKILFIHQLFSLKSGDLATD